MKPICVIPLRSGSRSIKNKNVKKLHNKPLCYYCIKTCLESKIFSKIIIATDSKKYIKILKKYFGKKIIFFLRSKKTATSQSPTESVLIEVLKKLNLKNFKDMYLIQATSPLLKKNDLIESYKLFLKGKFESMFSSYENKKFLWKKKKNKLKSLNYNYKKRPMRQFINNNNIFENGSFYIFTISKFLKFKNRLFGKIGNYLMPENRSLDIDEKKDFKLAKTLLFNS